MKNPSGRQATPEELLSTILGFIAARFYQREAEAFAQDRARLLKWVVLKPAAWLDDRGVTIHPDDYRKLFLDPAQGILMIALQHGNTEGLNTSRPGWEKRWNPGFGSRGIGCTRWPRITSGARRRSWWIGWPPPWGGIAAGRAPDPVRQLARSADLLRQPKRRSREPADNGQLSLL